MTRNLIKIHGGKYRIRKYLYKLLPDMSKIDTLFEGYVGGGSFFLGLKNLPKKLILNDIDYSLIQLYRTVKDDSLNISMDLYYLKHDKDVFDTYLNLIPTNTYESAVKRFVLSRMSRGGLCKTFGKSSRNRGGQDEYKNAWETAVNSLQEISIKLQNAEIINSDAINILTYRKDELDKSDTLIYCLHPDNLVRMENECLIKISELKNGDKLFGNKTLIKKMSKKYNGKILNIKTQGTPYSLLTTIDHKIPRIPRHFKKQETRTDNELWRSIELVKSEDLNVNDYLLIPLGGRFIKSIMELDFPNTTTTKKINLTDCKDLYRLIGYYAAEGHLNYQNNIPYSVIFSFCKDEEFTYVKDCAEICKKCFGIDAIVEKGPCDSVLQVIIHSTIIAKFFKKHVDGISTSKIFSNELMNELIENQLELLIGWIRGDGGIEYQERNRCKLTGTTMSKKMAEQLYLISLRCGLRPSFKIRGKNKTNDIYFSGDDILKLGFKSSVKKFRPTRRIINNHLLVRIKNITEKNYSGIVYDIDVDGDNLFSAPFCSVHNCDPPYLLSTRKSKKCYENEMSDMDHEILLKTITTYSNAKIMISGYDSTLYENILMQNFKYYPKWNKYHIEVTNNSGQSKTKQKRIETVWRNYWT